MGCTQAMGLSRYLLLIMWILISVDAAAERGNQYRLSEPTYHSISAIHKLLQENKPDESLRRLKKLAIKTRGNDYEQAVVYQTMGYAYHQLGDDDKAIKSFEKSLQDNVLPTRIARDVSHNLAQLLISAKRYREGLTYLARWLEDQEKPSAEILILAAIAHYNKGDCKQALPYANKAIAGSSRPEQAWYELSLSCYYELNQYRQALKILQDLVRRFPSKGGYWIQLAGVYQHLRRDQKAAAILELAYGMGMLGEAEILRLARLYLYLNTPYKAARLLQTEIKKGNITSTYKNWTLLADSLWLAKEQEQSLSAMREAAKLSPDGIMHYRLGRALYESQRWGEAVDALDSALKKKGLKQPEIAKLLLGIAAFHSGDETRSRAALELALRSKSTRDQAQWWLNKLDSYGDDFIP